MTRIQFLSSLLGCLTGAVCHADTVTLKPTADTMLWDRDPDKPRGTETSMVAGMLGAKAAYSKTRAVIQFNLTGQVPSGARISAATLTLRVVKIPNGAVNSTFNLQRVTHAWTEADATWNSPWSIGGGAAPVDFSSAISATQAVAGLGSYAFAPTAQLVADVQSWLDHPGSNQGWILLSQKESTGKTARHFATREDTNNSPILVITYDPSTSAPPAAPTGLTANPGSAQISLSWTAAPGATTYNLKRALVSGGPYSTIGASLAATSFADTMVTNGTTYFYAVSALNAGGESANSTPVSASPPAPAPPKIDSISVVGGQSGLRFTAQPNLKYSVEFRLELAAGNWQTLTNLSPQSSVVPMVVPDTLGTNAHRFYRLGILP